jgi:glycosyltransferase involved in cell wall biosynthesis
MRCAIVHYWLLGMRGGEKVVEALCRLYPQADIFTLFYDPDAVSPLIRSHRVTASFLNSLRTHYRSLLPLMPMALEHLDLRDYDLIISSESGPAKGIISSSRARHICYCHSPMRYLWDLYPEYLHEWTHAAWKRALMIGCSSYLRLWDYASASRVDRFVANSINVQKRIWRSYRRQSEVVYPPVAVETFYHRPAHDYFLVVSELVPYKRIEHAVQCFSRTGRRLKIVGDGPEYKRLKKVSAANIEFCGRVSSAELRGLYAHCRAVVQPGEEDFGIVAVEAIASGKSVIALGRGGVLESVPTADPQAGFFYETPGEANLEEAILQFERQENLIRSHELQAIALRFSEERFAEGMRRIIRAESEGLDQALSIESPVTTLLRRVNAG